MSSPLFPTITSDHWRAMFTRHRSNAEPNIVLAQIRDRISQQGAAPGAGRSHKPDAAGSTPAPATKFHRASGDEATQAATLERTVPDLGTGAPSNLSAGSSLAGCAESSREPGALITRPPTFSAAIVAASQPSLVCDMPHEALRS